MEYVRAVTYNVSEPTARKRQFLIAVSNFCLADPSENTWLLNFLFFRGRCLEPVYM
jgi:hypothetical protein